MLLWVGVSALGEELSKTDNPILLRVSLSPIPFVKGNSLSFFSFSLSIIFSFGGGTKFLCSGIFSWIKGEIFTIMSSSISGSSLFFW